MLYQLQDGTTIKLSLDQYLDMNEEEFQKMLMYRQGLEINDPFCDSIINDPRKRPDDEEEVLDEEEVPLSKYDLPEGFEELPEELKKD